MATEPIAALPLLFQFAVMIGSALVVYRSVAWSLDSPVLRRAFRNRPFGYGTKMSLMALIALTVRFMRTYGEGMFSPASIVSGLFFLLAGVVVLLFCMLIARDVGEVFLLVVKRLGGPLPEMEAPSETACAEAPLQTCKSERTCTATPRPCGARGVTTPWRQADFPRKPQHR